MVHYTDEVFLELHYRFHRVLAESDQIIVCGYSFGDKGVNKRILDRMSSPRPCRLLVIDPMRKEEFAVKARPAVAERLDRWSKTGRFTHWMDRLGSEKVTWKRVTAYCEGFPQDGTFCPA